LSKYSADAANIQESNSVNYLNLCATIWKVRIFERTLQLEILVKKRHRYDRQVKTTSILGAQNSRNNSMGQCQLMLENNEKNNKKMSIPFKFEDMMGAQKVQL
jgi:hypothetical protein